MTHSTSARGSAGDAVGEAARAPFRPVVDLVVVLVGAAVLGVAAGLLWPELVDPVTVTRTEGGVGRDELALSEQFDVEGWYSLLAAGGGLLLGLVMSAWRRADALVTLLAVVLGAFVAAWLSAEVGMARGPEDPTEMLGRADAGTTALAPLAIRAEAVYWVWPLFAVLGSLLYLLSPLSERSVNDEVSPEESSALPPRP